MRIVRAAARVLEIVVKASAVVAGASLVVIMVSIALNVAARRLLQQPIGGVIELSEAALLLMTFTGSAWVLRERGHVKIDLLSRMMPFAAARIATAVDVLGAALCSASTWYSLQVALNQAERGLISRDQLALPTWIFYGIVCFGFALLALQFLDRVRARHWPASDAERQAEAAPASYEPSINGTD